MAVEARKISVIVFLLDCGSFIPPRGVVVDVTGAVVTSKGADVTGAVVTTKTPVVGDTVVTWTLPVVDVWTAVAVVDTGRETVVKAAVVVVAFFVVTGSEVVL